MVRWFVDRSPSRGIPSVSLRRLLAGASFFGGRDWEVSGCSADAKTLEPGQVYVALRREQHDGHESIGKALERGAAGVIVDRPCPEAGPLQAIVPDTRAAHARICHALAGEPADRLALIGIAGERDAASVARLLRAIFERSGEIFGTVGPDEWSDGLATHPFATGRLEPDEVASMFTGMVRRGCNGGLIEASQSAIEGTAITEGFEFAAALVTTAGPAAAEDREVAEARRRAYARLVRRVRPGGLVVVDTDDPDSEILGAVNLLADRISIGIDRPADVRGVIESADAREIRFRLEGAGLDATVRLRLGVGGVTVRQALAAGALAWARGVAPDAIVAGIEAVAGPTERPEAVHEGQPFDVLVEETRTSDDLARALAALRVGRRGKIICVVGSEGGGDRADRRRLAEAAEAGADLVVFTTDNPRSEEPRRIFDDLLGGTRRPDQIRVEPDRRLAIETALAAACPGDAVVIAGKGQRTFQILANRVLPFDDRAITSRWLREANVPRRTSA
jgi:UDP-N-acetylmuramoyl-L-alanyl-D-glutamate--2,6-diaminopimelate ligase